MVQKKTKTTFKTKYNEYELKLKSSNKISAREDWYQMAIRFLLAMLFVTGSISAVWCQLETKIYFQSNKFSLLWNLWMDFRWEDQVISSQNPNHQHFVGANSVGSSSKYSFSFKTLIF